MNQVKYTRLKKKESTRLERREHRMALLVMLMCGEPFSLHTARVALDTARLYPDSRRMEKLGYLQRIIPGIEYRVTAKGKELLK